MPKQGKSLCLQRHTNLLVYGYSNSFGETLMKRLGVLICLALALSACGNSEKLASVDGETITKSEFEAYLKFKRLPTQDEHRKASMLDQYLEREALAVAIDKSKALDKELIDAELNEFRKEMLISRYFETILKEKVSDEAVRNYYTTNEKDYQEQKVHVAHILIRTNTTK